MTPHGAPKAPENPNEVGVHALRDGLSKYLAVVKSGGTVTVTEHGHAIARLVPVNGPSVLERLIAEGTVHMAARPKRSRPTPVQADGTVSDLVADQRR
ncbi:hypothetical protein [Alloactinosynnema sp. L-07]|uniref:type II toxin-antitoxin system Phd/YefM family antitoxin n=1 Tax=Alloactinosynnema sp. L-07 TaxID=1653480 RepID=UPI00065EF661|nr:type II toxin-antitoxin system prevent-host-death family antitoxin [Alloactinosynnema sp. L-07]CRK59461.1 hypothetical protein [Alloactinosynnema sp. L-07]